MIRRILMRRAYNSGRWERARYFARKIVNKPKEGKLARSVIIRSYWNQGDYSKVVELNQKWNGEFNHLLEKQSSIKNEFGPDGNRILPPKVLAWHNQQPSPKIIDFKFDEIEMCNNFLQEGGRVWMRHPHGWTFWDMPSGFSLKKTHSDLLKLTAEILLYPWRPKSRGKLERSRKKGKQPALSFSAGTDSTAASLIMPENTILGYHRRSVKSVLDHRNADRLLEHLKGKNRKVIDVTSNHELIRTYYGKQIGFSSDFACATHLILLSDMYDIGAIAFGMPLDNSYLWKGRLYRDFGEGEFFQYWSERFESAGLDLLLPIAGISEAGALMICKQSPLIDLMNSCLRGDGKNGCGKCWKCFHKNGPLGRYFDIEAREIQTFLNRIPMPTAIHALWAIQTMDLSTKIPLHLVPMLQRDLSWWTKFYPPSKEIIPIMWRDEIFEKISALLEIMDKPYQLEQVNLYDETRK
mgnify:CR=1 FL=1